MAGSNPGMVIKVAADIQAATAAFQDVTGEAAAMASQVAAATSGIAGDQSAITAAVGDTAVAYDDLGRSASADLGQVEGAIDDVDTATSGLSTSMVAFGSFVGSLAANLASEVFKVVWKALKEIGEALYEISGARDIVAAAWAGVHDELKKALDATGVVKAGLTAMGDELIKAFGPTKEELIANLVQWVNRIALAVVDAGIAMTTFGTGAAYVIAAINGPLILLTESFITLVERINASVAAIVGVAAQIPGVGDAFKGLAEQTRQDAAAWAEYRDTATSARLANDDMLRGMGPVHTALAATETGLRAAKGAMLEANAAAGETVDAFLRGGGAMKDYAGQAEAAIPITRDFSEQVRGVSTAFAEFKPAADMSGEAVRVFDTDLINAIPTTTNFTDNLIALKKPIDDVATGAYGMDQALADAGATMADTSADAVNMADKVRFAAETVATASLSWTEAMDRVRAGQGQMVATVGKPTKPAHMPQSEWDLMQKNPRVWEQLHGYDWSMPQKTGDILMQGYDKPASGTTNNINVNTVMGDKYEIARLVKDALADDWRSQGQRG